MSIDSKDLENYINMLKDFESQLNDDEGDLSTINDLNKLLGDLSNAVSVAQTQPVNVLEVGFKKLHKDAVIPSYAKPGDAGMDLTVTEIKEEDGYTITYGFGLAVEIPLGYVGLIFPRSSVRNYDLILTNCVGVIDSGYRGELLSTFKKTPNILKSLPFDYIKKYEIGERAAQILILPYPKIQPVEKKELTKTERNDGGFGHSGV
jgi:dUTP pyrophosphatase